MVRIQIEKAMPYSPEEMTTDSELISQSERGRHFGRGGQQREVNELAAPLIARGLIPSQVTICRTARGDAQPRRHLPFHLSGERVDRLRDRRGRKSQFHPQPRWRGRAPTAARPSPTDLERRAAGDQHFRSRILLAESLYEFRDTVEGIFATNAELIAVEVPPAETRLNLLPESWRARRAQLVRLKQWKKRLLIGAAAYAALLLLFRLPPHPPLSDSAARQANLDRRAQNGVCPGDGSEMEGAGPGDRPALLPDRSPRPLVR